MANNSSKRILGLADDNAATLPGLQHCLEVAMQQSNDLMDAVIDSLDTTVARAHGKGGSVEPKPVFKAAVELMVERREQMRASFANHLRVAMFGGVKSDSGPQPMLRFDDLQLLEEEKLDENIEAAWALQEITMAVEDVRPTLDALVSTLLGWITVQPAINPLRPEVFVRALRATMVEHIADSEVRSALMTPAAGRLGTALRKLYREISDWLRTQGIEPAGMPGRIKSRPGAPTTVGSKVARTILTLDRLRKLLSGDLDAGPSEFGKDFLYTVPASVEALQDMRMVDEMVDRLTKKRKDLGNSKPAWRTLDSKLIGKELGSEVIRLMVENLIDDERLLPRLRQVLQNLEKPLLLLAQTEPRFFSDKMHPARQLLDRITQRSLAYARETDSGFRGFIVPVEKIVKSLHAEADISATSFVLALRQLDEALTREDKAQKLKREEAARALLHAEQRNLLAQELAREFRERIASSAATPLPSFVVEFLSGPWAQVVAQSRLTYNDDTNATAAYNDLVDDLIWSVQPRVTRRNLTRLVELIPKMIAKMRQGLRLIAYPPELTVDFFDHLIKLHEVALEGARTRTQESRFRHSEAQDSGPNSRPWIAAHEASEAGFLEDRAFQASSSFGELANSQAAALSVTDLSIGSWVEIMLNNKWTRAQLTWVSPHRSLFMFTTADGKAQSMSRQTLSHLMGQRMLHVVSDTHLVDKALDAVTQMALRNSRNQSAK